MTYDDFKRFVAVEVRPHMTISDTNVVTARFCVSSRRDFDTSVPDDFASDFVVRQLWDFLQHKIGHADNDLEKAYFDGYRAGLTQREPIFDADSYRSYSPSEYEVTVG